MVEALCYNLRILGVSIYVSDNVFCNNKAIYKNAITPESVLNNKNHYSALHSFMEALDYKNISIKNNKT